MAGKQAFRGALSAPVDVDAVVASARSLGVLGWVRPTGELHAEGAPEAVSAFLEPLDVSGDRVRVEGHEQFAVRGVPAGRFVVLEAGGGFQLGLEVDGAMRCWTVPKGPSLDPADKRFAVPLDALDEGGATWDEGAYEQGGRVAWPEAISRGHAVFVLHGEKLRGGFALQRVKSGWLLVKRRDEHAMPS
jgi:hypothetical protein